MRINPDNRDNLLYALSDTQLQQNKALQQIASGRRIAVPSDDPAAMAELIQNRSNARANDEFSHNLTTIKSRLQTADSTLSSVVTAVERAIALGVQGANGTQSQSDRDGVAAEISGIFDNVLTLANTSFNGTYLFAGTNTQTRPFVTDAASASGVTYQGNLNSIDVPIGESRTMAMNETGAAIFVAPQGNIFQGLTDLRTALQQGNTGAISSATSALKNAFDHVRSRRVSFGNALSQIDAEGAFLSSDKLNLSEREESIAGADLAESISYLLNAQTARNATLAAAGQVSRLSLLDYLK